MYYVGIVLLDILKGLESQWKESKASCENLHIQLESLQLHSQVQQSKQPCLFINWLSYPVYNIIFSV